jgi:hypothetical protein
MTNEKLLKKYTAESTFIFTGKVLKSKASLIEGVITDNTLVMQVDHVITAPAIFSGIGQQQVTVRFKKLPRFRNGKTITVFTNGWIFGKTLALDAVGYTEESDKNSMAKMVQQSQTDTRDKVLKERLDSATIGVVGKVTKVERSNKQTTHISEHDPNWHEATIKVDDVVKGKKTTKEVKVLFPQSDDIRWSKINKYKEGQNGIWMLQQGKKQNKKGISAKVFSAIPDGSDVFTSIHESDYLPINELGRIKSLV